MRLWSHHTCRRLSKETPRLSGSSLGLQRRPLPEEIPMDEKGPVAQTFRRCLLSNLKESRGPTAPAAAALCGDTASRLQQLALNWFTGTHAPLLLHGDSFPAWFQGFISRRDAENQLKDKPVGCFLIRLSDKAAGYILSYRGRDRCRHCVITQNEVGKFIVVGDTETHSTLSGLIKYYRSHPIEPFWEYLTSSCHECSTTDIYDVVQPSGPNDFPTNWAPTVPPRSNRNPALASRYSEQPQLTGSSPAKSPVDGALEERCTRKNQVPHTKLGQNPASERIQPPLAISGGPHRVEAVQRRVRRGHHAGGSKQTEQFQCGTETVYSELQVEDHSQKWVQTKQRPYKHGSSPRDLSLLDRNTGKTMNKLCNSPVFQKTRGRLEQGRRCTDTPLVWHALQHDSVIYSTVCHHLTQGSTHAQHTYAQDSEPGYHSAAMATQMKHRSTFSPNP
ncbi:uncharacterized protein [Paramormyrops kingsleyae]|uniref:Uncharacterized LOC111843529 n=1 Tax=Paramormyrops kingsleyae TaxID=1676925 RepID=A0A3B3S1E3_9TELE|nr:uncharacterized protein LOC111843529 [Paramormyrops kingsleyae]